MSLEAFLSSVMAEELLAKCSANRSLVGSREAGSGADSGAASPAGVVGTFLPAQGEEGGSGQPSSHVLTVSGVQSRTVSPV